MAKCHPPQNDVGSLILNHSSSPHHHHCRLWNSFSLRKLLATVSCGGAAISKPSKPKNSHHPNTQINKPEPTPSTHGPGGSGKLADLLNLSSSSCSSERREKVEQNVEDVKKKEERLEELRMAVRLLHSEERENGAKLVRSFAKEDAEARSTLAMLGAIPPLVAMLDYDHHQSLIQPLYALLNLGIANDLNKAAIVQAGAVHKMLTKIESSNGCLNSAVSEAIVANFLALSALDSNKPIIGTSGAISYLVSVLEDTESSLQARQDSLRALYNLSITPSNIALILETNLIQYLVSMLGDMEMSERILSILSNVVSISEGRKAISNAPDVFPILIDALNWSDSPGCQEKACYVIMVMAHKSYSDRQTMIEAGVGSALLELTLLGSTLAQKRASRILECLRVDKGKQVSRSFVNNKTTAAVSAPICGSSSSTANVNKEEEDMMMSQEKKAVKQLVQQSLQNNMKRIVKRANLPQDFVPSEHLKSLTVSSTSKSLPF
ncbi:U-box domain-containing protein 14-like [Chenopodium quinoa]|uniref:U-box domain-containing protein 14-like n=1 Tax=Chenopodium quinoa TaxID=63459 RepID=UPI000B781B37|nr:U-box domain-containing protein 14-like [Chenopodium quinoa]